MKSFGIPEGIHQYVLEHSNPSVDDVSGRLSVMTQERFGGRSRMNIGDDQGRFLQMMVSMASATTVVEVGTIARGLAPGGQLICFELVDTYAETAKDAWQEAGVADRIETRFGPAAENLALLPCEPHIDLAFIDADKTGYRSYLDLLLPRIVDRGVILVDNVLWSGQVIDPADNSDDTVALREFNDHVAQRPDCDAVILTIGDGITMITPRRG